MTKVMIFGASGYLGSNIGQQLHLRNDNLILCSRKKPNFFDAHTMEFIKINNYSNPIDIEKMTGVSTIVFAGGLAHLKKAMQRKDGNIYNNANCTSALNLAQLAKTQKVEKFIYISTIGLHGRKSKHLINEKSPIIADDPYTKSKILAEKKLKEIFRNSTTKLIILRIPMVYGLNAPGNPEISLKLAKRWNLPIKALDKNKRTFLYIDNFTSAVKTIIDAKNIQSSIYCLSDDFSVSTLEYFQIITSLNGVTLRSFRLPKIIYKIFQRILPMPMITSIVTDMVVTNTKFRDHFQWAPLYCSKEKLLEKHNKETSNE